MVCTRTYFRRRRAWIIVFMIITVYLFYYTVSNDGYIQNMRSNTRRNHVVYFSHRSFINKPRKLILMWTPMFFSWSPWDTVKEVLKNCNSDSMCDMTTDKLRIQEADAVLFHCMDLMPWLRMPRYRRPDQVWVVWCVEPPTKIWNSLHGYRHVFNWTMHYRSDSTIYGGFGRVKKVDKGSDSINHPIPELTLKRILLVNSNCFDDIQRYKLYDQMQKYLPVDFYGSCGNLSCPRNSIECVKKLKNYRMSIQFENSYCKYYVSEKYFDALNNEQIPIVNWKSGQKALNVIPNSYINIYDFKTIKDAALHIRSVLENKTLYGSYFEWKNYYAIHDLSAWRQFCFLCRELHDNKRPAQVIVDVHDWFTDDMCPKASVFSLLRRWAKRFLYDVGL